MRLDEFARTADGAITAQDRVRFACVGFDLAPVVPPLVRFLRSGGAAIARYSDDTIHKRWGA